MNNKFKDYSLGLKIRNIISQILLPYTNDHKKILSSQLQLILTNVFKYREYQVSYEKMKILCFGKNKYLSITLQQYIDYISQKHFGENSINNFAYSHGYQRKDDKIMNQTQFVETLALGLSFIEDQKITKDFKEQFSLIYDEIVTDKNRMMSFLDYELFLKEYLGSQSPMSINPTEKIKELSQSQEIISSEKNINGEQSSILNHNPIKLIQQLHQNPILMLSNKEVNAYSLVNMNSYSKFQTALDQFQDLIYSQINSKCYLYDKDGDGYVFRKQFQTFLYDILELEYNSINFISNNYFNFTKTNKLSVKQFTEIICQINFRQIFTSIIKSQLRQTLSQRCIMSLTYFIQKITENCFFFLNKPSFRLLQRVYEQLINKSQNSHRKEITLQDFNNFILKYCCNNKLKLRQTINAKTNRNLSNPPVSITQVENSNYQQDQSQNNELRPIQPNTSEINSRRSKSIKEIIIDNNHCKSQFKNTENLLQSKKISSSSELQPKYQFLQENIYLKKQNQKKQKQNGDLRLRQNQEEQSELQQNFTKIQTQQLLKEEFDLKSQLWSKLEKLCIKYSIKSIGYLSRQQFQNLCKNESAFKQKLKFFKTILKLFQRQIYISIEAIIKYYIHFTGEEALIAFSKVQIKGKSILNINQAASLLFSAFNHIIQKKKQSFILFVQSYMINKNMDVFHYKNYLQFVGRDLTKTIYP